jgi:hypothetical protein
MAEDKNLPTTWADRLAKHAVAAAALETPDILNISFRGGHMTLDGVSVPNSDLDCVIITSSFENQYFDPEIPFDPDNLQNPICFAMSVDGEEMAPDASSPKIQHNGPCSDCWAAQWKSDPVRKKGKACKEKRKLMILPASQMINGGIKKASMAMASLSPTNVSLWSDYVNYLLNTYQRPPFAVLTTISVRPHPKKQLEVTYKCKGMVGDEHLSDIMDRIPGAQKIMTRPYEGKPDDPTKATTENKKPRKF